MVESKDKPKNAIGIEITGTNQPVEPYHPDRPIGERQDGPGAGPRRHDRHDALPAGSTAKMRSEGSGGPQGHPEEPEAGHRGQPASQTSGAATGSGSGAGGGGTGTIEEPDPDSAGGGGRDPRFGAPPR